MKPKSTSSDHEIQGGPKELDIIVQTSQDLKERVSPSENYNSIKFRSLSADDLIWFLLLVLKTKLRHLSILDTPMTQQCILHLYDLLNTNKTIEELELVNSGEQGRDSSTSSVELSEKSIEILCKSFCKSSVTTFSIQSCQLTVDGVYYLVDMLTNNTTLKTLKLDSAYKIICQEHSNYEEFKHKLHFV